MNHFISTQRELGATLLLLNFQVHNESGKPTVRWLGSFISYARSPALLRRTYTNSLNAEKKGILYSITERRVPVLGSQPAGDVSHKPGGRLPLISARPAVTPATLKRAVTNFATW